MIIALGAKSKLGFIDGNCVKPNERSEDLEQWKMVDYMVTSWILNYIAKELVEAFLYVSSSAQLWNEIKERYGEANGPMIYQLKREISSISQGNMTVAEYYTKLKMLWDELLYLMPLPNLDHECNAVKELTNMMFSGQLMEFLIGLNERFDSIRNQILLLEPLPTVNKAYSIVTRVEKQMEVQVLMNGEAGSAAMFVKSQSTNTGGNYSNNSNTGNFEEKG